MHQGDFLEPPLIRAIDRQYHCVYQKTITPPFVLENESYCLALDLRAQIRRFEYFYHNHIAHHGSSAPRDSGHPWRCAEAPPRPSRFGTPLHQLQPPYVTIRGNHILKLDAMVSIMPGLPGNAASTVREGGGQVSQCVFCPAYPVGRPRDCYRDSPSLVSANSLPIFKVSQNQEHARLYYSFPKICTAPATWGRIYLVERFETLNRIEQAVSSCRYCRSGRLEYTRYSQSSSKGGVFVERYRCSRCGAIPRLDPDFWGYHELPQAAQRQTGQDQREHFADQLERLPDLQNRSREKRVSDFVRHLIKGDDYFAGLVQARYFLVERRLSLPEYELHE